MSRARDLALRARGLLDVLDAVDRDVAPTRAQKPVVDLDAPLRAFVDASARDDAPDNSTWSALLKWCARARDARRATRGTTTTNEDGDARVARDGQIFDEI